MENVVYVVMKNGEILETYKTVKPARSMATSVAKFNAMRDLGMSEFNKLDKNQIKHQVTLMKIKYSIEVKVFKDSGIKM